MNPFVGEGHPPASTIASRNGIAHRCSKSTIAAADPFGITSATYQTLLLRDHVAVFRGRATHVAPASIASSSP